MKPTGWTWARLQGECDFCGASQPVEWKDYFTAIETGAQMRCVSCQEVQPMHDRRQRSQDVPDDRRGAQAAERNAS